MLLLVACSAGINLKDTAPQGTDDSAADSGGDTADTADSGDSGDSGDTADTGEPDPEALGFDVDGEWYSLGPGDTYCQNQGNLFVTVSAGEDTPVHYTYFGGAPPPGDYTLTEWTGMESTLPPTLAGMAVVTYGADMFIGDSDGSGGTVKVWVADDGARWVSWTDASLGDHTSASGLLVCP